MAPLDTDPSCPHSNRTRAVSNTSRAGRTNSTIRRSGPTLTTRSCRGHWIPDPGWTRLSPRWQHCGDVHHQGLRSHLGHEVLIPDHHLLEPVVEHAGASRSEYKQHPMNRRPDVVEGGHPSPCVCGVCGIWRLEYSDDAAAVLGWNTAVATGSRAPQAPPSRAVPSRGPRHRSARGLIGPPHGVGQAKLRIRWAREY